MALCKLGGMAGAIISFFFCKCFSTLNQDLFRHASHVHYSMCTYVHCAVTAVHRVAGEPSDVVDSPMDTLTSGLCAAAGGQALTRREEPAAQHTGRAVERERGG